MTILSVFVQLLLSFVGGAVLILALPIVFTNGGKKLQHCFPSQALPFALIPGILFFMLTLSVLYIALTRIPQADDSQPVLYASAIVLWICTWLCVGIQSSTQ